jgi:hypothetical protein
MTYEDVHPLPSSRTSKSSTDGTVLTIITISTINEKCKNSTTSPKVINGTDETDAISCFRTYVPSSATPKSAVILNLAAK